MKSYHSGVAFDCSALELQSWVGLCRLTGSLVLTWNVACFHHSTKRPSPTSFFPITITGRNANYQFYSDPHPPPCLTELRKWTRISVSVITQHCSPATLSVDINKRVKNADFHPSFLLSVMPFLLHVSFHNSFLLSVRYAFYCFPLRFKPIPECATLDSHVSDQGRIRDFIYWV